MVKYGILLDVNAEADLKRIYEYLKDSASEDTADHVRNGILATIGSLATFPHRHKIESSISNKQTTYRRILKWSYKIVYTIEEDTIRVIVVDISHAKQDPRILIEKFKN